MCVINHTSIRMVIAEALGASNRPGPQLSLLPSASCSSASVDPRALGAQFAAELFHPQRAQGILSCLNKEP